MASVNDPRFGMDNKASSLTARRTTDTADKGKRARNRTLGVEDIPHSTDSRRKGSVWVDLILLVVLATVIVGGVMGYRTLKRVYAPEWEERDIVFVMDVSHVNASILPDFWHAEAPLYVSDSVDAAPVGYLMDSPYVMDDASEDGYVTVRLLLHGKARYRKGEGYYCGNTPILAGLSGDVRVDGVSGNGMIMMVLEADEYAALIAETSADS